MQQADRGGSTGSRPSGQTVHASDANLDIVFDSGSPTPHPWGGLNEAVDRDDQPWRTDPWQGQDADYRRWQQTRYRQLADEFKR